MTFLDSDPNRNDDLSRFLPPLNSLQLTLDVERYLVCGLKDLLQAQDIVGVGVSEGNVVWKAADLHGLRTATDQLIRHHDGAVQAQSLT